VCIELAIDLAPPPPVKFIVFDVFEKEEGPMLVVRYYSRRLTPEGVSENGKVDYG